MSEQKANGPLFRGFLTTNEKDSKVRKNLGKVALWPNNSQNAKAPLYTGTIQTEKSSYRIVLWRSEKKESNEL
jgi:hypothetical protein